MNVIYHRPGRNGVELAWQGQASIGPGTVTLSGGAQVAGVLNTELGQLSLFIQGMSGVGGSVGGVMQPQTSIAAGAQLLWDIGHGMSAGVGAQVGATAGVNEDSDSEVTGDAVVSFIVQYGSNPRHLRP